MNINKFITVIMYIIKMFEQALLKIMKQLTGKDMNWSEFIAEFGA